MSWTKQTKVTDTWSSQAKVTDVWTKILDVTDTWTKQVKIEPMVPGVIVTGMPMGLLMSLTYNKE